jgi:hypothetical protein
MGGWACLEGGQEDKQGQGGACLALRAVRPELCSLPASIKETFKEERRAKPKPRSEGMGRPMVDGRE